MIKLTEEDILRHQDATMIRLKMKCMICMSFPEITFQIDDPSLWQQLPNPVPSNRMCFHVKHKLMCPHCEFAVISEQEEREMYFMESAFRDLILKRDEYTCQACSYKHNGKPLSVSRR